MTEHVDTVVVDVPTGDDWLAQEDLDRMTQQSLLKRVDDLHDLIAGHALETEQARRPVSSVWSALRRSGIFYHFVPKRYGGLEFDIDSFVNIGTSIARGCASTAWVSAFCMEHNWIMSLFCEEAQDEIFGRTPYIIAPATSNPIGLARPEGAGYRVSGRWRFSSGVMNADWAMVLAAVENMPPTATRWFLMPVSDVCVLDTWHVDGLAGTGSADMVVDDVFVPAHRTLLMSDVAVGTAPGAVLHDHWLYRMPAVPFLALTTALPAVGAAQGALARFRARCLERIQYGSEQTQAHKPVTHLHLASLALDVETAGLLLRESAAALREMGEQGRAGDIDARIRVRAMVARAAHIARRVTSEVVSISGAGAHLLTDPLQRAARDAAMVTTHIMHDQDLINEQYGRAQLGMEPTTYMI